VADQPHQLFHARVRVVTYDAFQDLVFAPGEVLVLLVMAVKHPERLPFPCRRAVAFAA